MIGNMGARKVANLPKRHNNDLHAIISHFNICVQSFFATCIVKFIGHTFRHAQHPLCQLLSLPLPSRLTSIRRQGRVGVASVSAQANHNFMAFLGIDMQPLVAGPLGVRGHSGYVCRWGEGWFWDMRDGGPGWIFEKHDSHAISVRVDVLLEVFRKKRSNLPQLVADSAPLPLEDG